jgi:ribosome production factor 1
MSEIKNKIRRHEIWSEVKREKRKQKDERRQARIREREVLGDAAPPKLVPHTLESMRTADPTMVNVNDEEILKDEDEDEWSKFFKGGVDPKIMITSGATMSKRTRLFTKELKQLWPHSDFYPRQQYALKKVTKIAVHQNFTDLVVITEQNEEPYIMILSHLPHGPTATFRISSFKSASEIPDVGPRSTHAPELILKNFDTRLGRRVGRMLTATFKLVPQYKGRAVATLHNQRDFIFVRLHRYIFDSLSKVRIQELG